MSVNTAAHDPSGKGAVNSADSGHLPSFAGEEGVTTVHMI
jgi:hypothetical protein